MQGVEGFNYFSEFPLTPPLWLFLGDVVVLITTHFSHSITIGLEAPGILEYMIFNISIELSCHAVHF